jgi:hypothetical protein
MMSFTEYVEKPFAPTVQRMKESVPHQLIPQWKPR